MDLIQSIPGHGPLAEPPISLRSAVDQGWLPNAVTKNKAADVAVFDTSMFEADAGAGNQNITADDLALPFLKLLSGLDSLLDTHETARKGDIYNTVTGAVISGKEGLSVIPCAYKRVFIQWVPRGSGTGAPIEVWEPTDKAMPKTERSKEDNKKLPPNESK